MRSTTLLLALPALGLAFPSFLGADNKEEILENLRQQKRAESEAAKVTERQLLGSNGLLGGGLLGSLLNDVGGLLGSVASAVDPNNKRPEPGYEFKAPGPNDSRGPCPGLNLLANYGYLPRDGYVNFGQVLDATARGFNMGADLAALLALFAVEANGDLASQSFYLGTNSDHVGGLNRHSTVEADVSPNREDYYLGCGDNHHLSSRLFKQNVALAAQDPKKEFTLDVMGNQYAKSAKFSQQNNPFIYYFPFPSIVSLGAFVFYPNFFSNGTYGDGGVANYESISSIIGAKLNEETGEFEYVPERWPENWYRRATPYGAVQALTEALEYIYPKYILGMPFGQLGTDNLNVQTILCSAQQGFNSITPLALAGQVDSLEGSISWALGQLADLGLSDTILGCPTDTLSPNFYTANATVEGGPLNPPPATFANTGNNVYNKVYFGGDSAPTTPKCNHAS